MTITELAVLIDEFAVKADAVSAMALGDAMEELGHAESANLLRTGRIKNTRLCLPPRCEFPQCSEAALGFVAPVSSDDVAAMCNWHARYATGAPSQICMNCGCRANSHLDPPAAPSAGESRT